MEPVTLPESLDTERMHLRRFRFADLDDVVEYASNPEWGRFLPVPVPYKPEDGEFFLAQRRIEDWGEQCTWAMVLRGRACGGVTLILQHEQRRAMLGYSVARPLWGQGLVLEASRAVIGVAFDTQAWLHKVWANADSRNTGSMRVMEKLGMTREGCLRGHRQHRGEPLDDVYFGLLRPEWEAATGTPS
jgi:[ribosomal protein S5]-alanine N-acetyltransferase